MFFHSADYLLFLVIVVSAFWLLRDRLRLRLGMLFVMSCAFYMGWRAEYVALILFSTLVDYWLGGALYVAEKERTRKLLLALSVVSNLGLLFAFKYYNYFALELNDALGSELAPFLNAVLPVGISFYVFQTLSYTIDIYRREIKPAENLLSFATYVTYFPQLVAGPIVRAKELLPQLEQERASVREEQVSEGLLLIATGLVKKVAIADFLSLNLVDRVFDNPSMFSALEVVVALYAFTMQIYADFSGYTDVARGSAKLMGLELPENFDRPYKASSPAEFWRTWHMTLSRWLRDYLYFPLGGSQKGQLRAYFNLAITMFLVGIWHGWWGNFEVFFWYALLQTGAMVGHRFAYRLAKRDKTTVDPAPIHALKIFANLQFVVFSRILFRSESMENAREVADRVVSGPWILEAGDGRWELASVQITWLLWAVLIATFAAHYTPRSWWKRVQTTFIGLHPAAQALVLLGVLLFLVHVAAAEAAPFIYFQF